MIGGKNKERAMKTHDFTLLKPSPDKCQECAVDHFPEQPHNKDSLFYQSWFHKRHGHYPTWEDAIAHCDEKLRAAWKEELMLRGVWTERR
jgi:hypothetical protein